MQIKALVTGTGRCGTMWASRTLTQKGLSCSHEGFFNFDAPKTVWARVEGSIPPTESGISIARQAIISPRVADASYMAMPYLSDPRLADVPVLHLVRHPLNVISSFVLDMGYFGGEKPEDYHFVWEHWIARHWKSPGGCAATNAADYYVFWNDRIEQTAQIYRRRRVEDGLEDDFEFLRFKPTLKPAIINANSFKDRRKRKPIQWSEIANPQRTRLQEMTKRYGYRIGKVF